jgi:hypothetical protein
MQAGNFGSAISRFSDAIAMFPNEYQLWGFRSAALTEALQYTAAHSDALKVAFLCFCFFVFSGCCGRNGCVVCVVHMYIYIIFFFERSLIFSPTVLRDICDLGMFFALVMSFRKFVFFSFSSF